MSIRRIAPTISPVAEPASGDEADRWELVEDQLRDAPVTSSPDRRWTLLVVAALGAVVGFGFGSAMDRTTVIVAAQVEQTPAPAPAAQVARPREVAIAEAVKVFRASGSVDRGRARIQVTLIEAAHGTARLQLDWSDPTTGTWGTTWQTLPD
jgi:hypothetical protein